MLACAGDVVTMETVAAAQLLREMLPDLVVRVVNVVDLMTLPRPQDHPHGVDKTFFSELFTDRVDVVFSFHGFPGAVHQLVHGRPDADRFHVRGFIDQGTTTTPFDMVVRNRASRYHLVMDAINNAKRTPPGASAVKAWCAVPAGPAPRLHRRAPGGHARGPRLDLAATGSGGLSMTSLVRRSGGSRPCRRPSASPWCGRAPSVGSAGTRRTDPRSCR